MLQHGLRGCRQFAQQLVVIFVVWADTVWESDWTQFFDAGHALHEQLQLSVNFVDFILPCAGTAACSLSRSEAESLGEPKFEEESCTGDGGTGLSDASSLRGMRSWWETTKEGCRHLDKTKPEKLVTQKKHTHVRTGSGLSQNGIR